MQLASSLQVFAQRRPSLHRLLDWEDEFFALITAILDRQSLAANSASFADSMYGLRRATCTSEQQGGAATPLSHRERQAALLSLVCVLPWTARHDREHDYRATCLMTQCLCPENCWTPSRKEQSAQSIHLSALGLQAAVAIVEVDILLSARWPCPTSGRRWRPCMTSTGIARTPHWGWQRFDGLPSVLVAKM